jgi:hypothetical protein
MRIFCKIFPFDLRNKSTDFPPIKLNFFHHIIIIVIIIIIIIIVILGRQIKAGIQKNFLLALPVLFSFNVKSFLGC